MIKLQFLKYFRTKIIHIKPSIYSEVVLKTSPKLVGSKRLIIGYISKLFVFKTYLTDQSSDSSPISQSK